MIRKYFLMIAAAIVVSSTGISCTEDLSDCPNKLCVIAGGWKLQEVRLDGELFTGDYSQYELVLNSPTPTTDVSSQFHRVNIGGGEDSGTWSIENTNPSESSKFTGSILRLRPSGGPTASEDWEIESFTPREMILVMHRDISVKEGPATIRFILVPF